MFDIVIFTILIFLSAFFSSAETAFFSLSPARVRMMRQKKYCCATQVDILKRDPHRLLITILIGNNIVNLFTASYATVVAAQFFGSAALGIATGITTFFILVFGEIIPKSFAYAKNAQLARIAAWPIFVLSIALYPAVYSLRFISLYLNKKFKGESDGEDVTEEEVRALARIGVEKGAINYREHEMIENIFELDDISVGDIATPWYKVVALSGLVPVEQIAYFVSQKGHSRYPVHDGKNEDTIIGYVHVNHIMKALNSDERDQPLTNFAVPIERVSEDMSIERVFRAMLKKRMHMFLVHKEKDEKDIIGLVTLENILEEIVGEIHDETDKRVRKK